MKYKNLFLLIFGIFLLSFCGVSTVRAVDCFDDDADSDRYYLSESCSFPGALLDGIDSDSGATGTNSAILTVVEGVTLTIPAQQTLATGIIDLKGGGSIVIVKNGQIKLKAPIYMTDSDDDHTPASTSATLIPNVADKRKHTITAPTSSDCNDSYTGYENTLSENYYPDLDGDTYTTSATSAGTARCSSQTTWDTTTSVTYPGQTADPTTVTLATRKNSANGSDCHDTGTDANLVWASNTCYIDLDNDNWTNGTKTCTNAACASATKASTGNSTTVVTYTAGNLQATIGDGSDSNDAQACATGANPAGTCNKCVTGAIAYQTSSQDLFNECTATGIVVRWNEQSDKTCTQFCADYSHTEDLCNGSSAACATHSGSCASIGTDTGGTNTYYTGWSATLEDCIPKVGSCSTKMAVSSLGCQVTRCRCQ